MSEENATTYVTDINVIIGDTPANAVKALVGEFADNFDMEALEQGYVDYLAGFLPNGYSINGQSIYRLHSMPDSLDPDTLRVMINEEADTFDPILYATNTDDMPRIVDASPSYDLNTKATCCDHDATTDATPHVYAVGDSVKITCPDGINRPGTIDTIESLGAGPVMWVALDPPHRAPWSLTDDVTRAMAWLSDDRTTITGPMESTTVELIEPGDDQTRVAETDSHAPGETVDDSETDGVHRHRAIGPLEADRLRKLITAHLYVCDQNDDLCYKTESNPGENWAEFADRRSRHLVDEITQLNERWMTI